MSRKNSTAGARDRMVTIQSRPSADEQAPSRYPIEEWTDLVDVWAGKEELQGSERFAFAADQHTAPYDTRWTIPWFDNMDPENVNVRKLRRLVVNGRVHDIVHAEEIGRREGIDLLTQAGGLLE